MIPHNNEINDLHKGCSYIYKDTLCKITYLSNYPKVTIMYLKGDSLVIDACDLSHIELNDQYLDNLADRTTVSATTPKIWYFDDKIPISVFRSGKGWYLLNTPFNKESKDAPLPIVSVDELEHIRGHILTDTNLIRTWDRVKRLAKKQ